METIINTESAGRRVWVVKVPPFVAKQWRGVCEQSAQAEAEVGPKLGVIRYTTNAADSQGKAGPKFELHLDNDATASLPQQYDMQSVTGNAPTMLAFSQDGRGAAAEGIVQHRFDIEPAHGSGSLNPAYAAISKQRTQAEGNKIRKIQVMPGHQITDIRRPDALMTLGPAKRKEPTEKRIAKPAAELQADLFRLFERQAHWNFVQLQKQTEQPTQHLKAVLIEIALQNKRGPYKDLWELRKEFKTGGGSAAPAPPPPPGSSAPPNA